MIQQQVDELKLHHQAERDAHNDALTQAELALSGEFHFFIAA